jgi:2'-5' RNA ligase
MRLFLAIPLSPAVRDQLAAIRARLERPDDNLRWSAPESWHITLQFLGATTPAQYDCVLSRLRTLSAAPVPVQLEALGFFHRTGVFFAGIHLTPSLVALQQRIVSATTPCGFVPETRPYHPHITLARNRSGANGIGTLQPRAGAAPAFDPFTAQEFLLYESFLGPSGSRYEVRARFPLAGD